MRTLTIFMLACAAVLFSLSCGDSDISDPDVDPANLLVEAVIEGTDQADGFGAQYEVRVSDADGEPASGAIVTLSHGEIDAIELEEQGEGSGVYTGTGVYAPGDYTLEVEWGDEILKGAVVNALEIHTIESPEAGETVPQDAPLTVTWTDASESAKVHVETRDFETDPEGEIDDTGSYTIPAEGNPRRPNDQRIRVTRYTAAEITGALAGSRFEVSIRNSVESIRVRN